PSHYTTLFRSRLPQREGARRLPLRRLRHPAVHERGEVRLRLRLALVLRRRGPRQRLAPRGPLLRDAPRRGHLRYLWRPPRPPLPRRAAREDRPPLLHQLRLPDARPGHGPRGGEVGLRRTRPRPRAASAPTARRPPAPCRGGS